MIDITKLIKIIKTPGVKTAVKFSCRNEFAELELLEDSDRYFIVNNGQAQELRKKGETVIFFCGLNLWGKLVNAPGLKYVPDHYGGVKEVWVK